MKARLYISLWAISFLMVVTHHSDVSAASIPYKKKVQVQPFQNPPGWVGTYSPGTLVSDLLKQKLLQQENVTVVRFMDPVPDGSVEKKSSAILVVNSPGWRHAAAL